jgi:hypothetical protein
MITFPSRLPEPFGDMMRPFRSVLMAGPYALLLTAAMLSGCLFDNPSGSPDAPGEVINTSAYSVKGNTIFLPPNARSNAYCDMDSLVTQVDTTGADTIEFKIVGPILTVTINPSTLELKGRENGEIVRITWSGRADRTYTSSLPDHAVHRHFRIPTSCPNENAPEWYGAFLEWNRIQRAPKAGLPIR